MVDPASANSDRRDSTEREDAMTTMRINDHPAKNVRRRWLAVVGCLFLVAGCASDGTSGSSEPSEVRDMRLVYDGETCVYEGGEMLAAGPVSLELENQNDGYAAMNMVRHAADETIADMQEYIGEEPSSKHAPSWSREVRDVWRPTPAGETYRWDGEVEPGIHTLVCAQTSPLGVYFAAGLTVTE